MDHRVVGIDLGTTNSEVAALVNGQVKVLGPKRSQILPSCVGLSLDGALLVGEAARNQHLVYPERTVRSIKRQMGTAHSVTLGDRNFSPQEISSLILRELVDWAQRGLGQEVRQAVITVPAYFSDAQRQATREAGQLAGLEVLRILNEPTAASLAYGFGEGKHTALVYDLGGGTFDVSVVTVENDVTEVLASHGNNRLGGDDFDALLVEFLAQTFQERHGVNLRTGHPAALARLWWAAEEAKKRLSLEPYTVVREEALLVEGGKPLHLEVEMSRTDYENMIGPLVESTLDSVSKALSDAHKGPSDIDEVLLVGGSTRTPLVSRLLVEKLGKRPRQDVHPDLCVALGAGVLAARLAGHHVSKVLVDVSPYSFGPSFLGEKDGEFYPFCYKPVIARNTPLPVTRTEIYFTASAYQSEVELSIYQGDDPDALKNLLVGQFRIGNLHEQEEPNEVLCRMSLDLDGILQVTAVEKQSGKQKSITIDGALKAKTELEVAAARSQSQALFALRSGEAAEFDEHTPLPKTEQPLAIPESEAARQARDLVERSRCLLERMHPDDAEEAVELNERVVKGLAANDEGDLREALELLRELLFYVEAR
ncbi:MAG TPA: Hsp70 family protein [Candidatus Xenobia bacterium]|jgi:molecular chaperone DnaK (HSP70)